MFKKWFVTAYREIQVWALKLNIWYQDLIGVPYKKCISKYILSLIHVYCVEVLFRNTALWLKAFNLI